MIKNIIQYLKNSNVTDNLAPICKEINIINSIQSKELKKQQNFSSQIKFGDTFHEVETSLNDSLNNSFTSDNSRSTSRQNSKNHSTNNSHSSQFNLVKNQFSNHFEKQYLQKFTMMISPKKLELKSRRLDSKYMSNNNNHHTPSSTFSNITNNNKNYQINQNFIQNQFQDSNFYSKFNNLSPIRTSITFKTQIIEPFDKLFQESLEQQNQFQSKAHIVTQSPRKSEIINAKKTQDFEQTIIFSEDSMALPQQTKKAKKVRFSGVPPLEQDEKKNRKLYMQDQQKSIKKQRFQAKIQELQNSVKDLPKLEQPETKQRVNFRKSKQLVRGQLRTQLEEIQQSHEQRQELRYRR